MARLDIGVGEDFPLEEKKSSGEDCRGARRGHWHHHHPHTHFWHGWFRRRPERKPDDHNSQDKE
ncbi:MAG TPA: hypothetical protein VFV07_12320 [Rhizomicrobium sp.]|nr:hypothetical protein [Rhizomicrobium sp.]